MLTVVFDMDDVLVNLNEKWVDYLNNKYKLSVKKEDIIDWNMSLFFPTLSENQLFECLHNLDFWKTVTPKPYSKEILLNCHNNQNIDYYIVTAALPKNFYVKYEHCLKVLFPFVPSNRFICCNNKKLINCDVIVDDNINNFPETDINSKPVRILFDTPWNKDIESENYNYRSDELESINFLIQLMSDLEIDKHWDNMEEYLDKISKCESDKKFIKNKPNTTEQDNLLLKSYTQEEVNKLTLQERSAILNDFDIAIRKALIKGSGYKSLIKFKNKFIKLAFNNLK